MHEEIVAFIELFHPKEQPGVSEVNTLLYTNGQCLRFAQILATAFKHLDPVIVGTGLIAPRTAYKDIRSEILDRTFNHYVVYIDGNYYDIHGWLGDTAADLDVDERITIDGWEAKNPKRVNISQYFDSTYPYKCLNGVKVEYHLSLEEVESIVNNRVHMFKSSWIEKRCKQFLTNPVFEKEGDHEAV